MSARLFVALELPADAREALARWRSSVAASVPGLRLVQGDDMHVTLCFLGSRPEEEIEAIGAACGVVAGEPVADAEFGSALWLPARRPRVLAVALSDPEGAIGRIQSALSDALVAGGWYVPESRPFLAHVTVARVSRDARVRAVELPAPPEIAVRCSRVTLYRSRLGAGGARYWPSPRWIWGRRRAPRIRCRSCGGSTRRRLACMWLPPPWIRCASYSSDGVLWHVPGASAIAGSHRGIEAVLEYFDTRRRMTDSTFRVTDPRRRDDRRSRRPACRRTGGA